MSCVSTTRRGQRKIGGCDARSRSDRWETIWMRAIQMGRRPTEEAGRQCRMKAGMRLQRALIRLFLWFAQSANPQSAFPLVQEGDNKEN